MGVSLMVWQASPSLLCELPNKLRRPENKCDLRFVGTREPAEIRIQRVTMFNRGRGRGLTCESCQRLYGVADRNDEAESPEREGWGFI